MQNKEITNKNKKISFWKEIKEDIKITFQKKKWWIFAIYLPIAAFFSFIGIKSLQKGSVEKLSLFGYLSCLIVSFFVIFSFFVIHRYLGRQQEEINKMLSGLSKKAKKYNPTKYRQIRNARSLFTIFFLLNLLGGYVYLLSLPDNGYSHETLLAASYSSTAIFGLIFVGLFFIASCHGLAQEPLKEKSNALK